MPVLTEEYTESTTTTTPVMIDPAIVAKIPAVVRDSLAELTAEQQDRFIAQYDSRAKSVGVAYTLFLLLGAHYAYFGRWGLQAIWWLTLGGLGVWALIDLFRIPKLSARYNDEVATLAMRTVKVLS